MKSKTRRIRTTPRFTDESAQSITLPTKRTSIRNKQSYETHVQTMQNMGTNGNPCVRLCWKVIHASFHEHESPRSAKYIHTKGFAAPPTVRFPFPFSTQLIIGRWGSSMIEYCGIWLPATRPTFLWGLCQYIYIYIYIVFVETVLMEIELGKCFKPFVEKCIFNIYAALDAHRDVIKIFWVEIPISWHVW